ncbi:3-carboxy-cis,cis-muconate cycloisomerase [Marivita sp. S6314]|uniref:3-carboxy-cis,cis-muconate cycloisomerase n=1 Tax=Marivita sp. S6314 TaxID=2926406 RepID=UPI001FF3775B|nr:3-carboxy-cis,cis-muconate cycloisomerase [Marivita sp. S6314]MCK0150754.1 3-carboxy-cis,cis-muconate cycloisomerase [Marivita sp. S6314]
MTNAFTTSGLFGDLFQDPEIAAQFSAATFFKHALAFETAWTETLMALGAVKPKDGQAALEAMRQYVPDLLAIHASSNTDGLPVPGFVSQLRERLKDRPAKAVHTGATSQDVIDTAMVLTLMDVFAILETRLQRVIGALARLDAHAQGEMMGRTRMQAALPIPVSARIQSWASPLRDHLERLDGVRAHVGQVQLGGPVGVRDVPAGQGDAAASDLARRLGLRIGPVWHSNRTPIVEVGHWLTLVSGSLGKLGQDVALMAQQGVDDIKVAGGGGSSAMPHKDNPVLAETLVTLACFVGIQNGGLAQALVHEQERSGVAWALEWMLLPAMAEATGAALRHTEQLLERITRIGPEHVD